MQLWTEQKIAPVTQKQMEKTLQRDISFLTCSYIIFSAMLLLLSMLLFVTTNRLCNNTH